MITFSSDLFAAIAAEPAPRCQCGECDSPLFWDVDETEPRRFECEGCERWVPWCYGADDRLEQFGSLFAYCDDCVAEIKKTRQRRSPDSDSLDPVEGQYIDFQK